MFEVFKKKETDAEIKERLLKLCKEGNFGICPPPMDANVAINELAEYFLGKDWGTTMSLGREQVVTEIVYELETRFKRFKAK